MAGVHLPLKPKGLPPLFGVLPMARLVFESLEPRVLLSASVHPLAIPESAAADISVQPAGVIVELQRQGGSISMEPTGEATFSQASTAVMSTTYHVATSGSDSNPGTLEQPFLTLNAGVRVLTPGDTLLVHPGLYEEPLHSVIPSGLSWDLPVTVQAFDPLNRPVIRPGTGAARVLDFGDISTDQYIVVDGFVLDGVSVTFDTVKLHGLAHHIRIANSEVMNSPNQGILVIGDDNQFINLNVHDNGDDSQFDHGIYLSGSRNLVEGSDVHHNASYGIHIFGPSPDDNIVRNTIVRDHGVKPGIVVNGDRNNIYNNLIFQNRGGIEVFGGNLDGKFHNNTIFGNTGPGIQALSPVTVNASIKNNLVYQNTSGIINSSTGSVIANNLTADPLFVDAASGDFRIRFGSPAMEAGLNLAAVGVTTDFAGVLRPQGGFYDIGAYEVALDAPPPPEAPTLDVDGDLAYTAETDGRLILRYLAGASESQLVAGLPFAPNATRTSALSIIAYLDPLRTSMLDIDGNGIADPFTDGRLLIRVLQGTSDGQLLAGAVLGPGAVRTTTGPIRSFLSLYQPSLAPAQTTVNGERPPSSSNPQVASAIAATQLNQSTPLLPQTSGTPGSDDTSTTSGGTQSATASPLVDLSQPNTTGSGLSLSTAYTSATISQPAWVSEFVNDGGTQEIETEQLSVIGRTV